MDKYGDQVIIELKWGQGAKDIGGEIQVDSLADAMFLKSAATSSTRIRCSTRSKRRTSTAPSSPSRATAASATPTSPRRNRCVSDFMRPVEYLREIGYRRISLKTGSYGMEALAMAIRYASDTSSIC